MAGAPSAADDALWPTTQHGFSHDEIEMLKNTLNSTFYGFERHTPGTGMSEAEESAYFASVKALVTKSVAFFRSEIEKAKQAAYGEFVAESKGGTGNDSLSARRWAQLGHLHLIMNDFDNAYAAYERVIAIHRPPTEPVFWYGLGLCVFYYGWWDQVEAILKLVLRLAPGFVRKGDVHVRLGIAYRQEERLEEALEEFGLSLSSIDKGFKQALSAGEVELHLAEVYEAMGKTADARAIYESLERLEHDPAVTIARLHHGVCLTSIGLHEQAVVRLQDCVRVDSRDFRAWYNLGRAFADMSMFHEAFDAFNRAIQLDGTSADCWLSIGNLYHRHGQILYAFDMYKRAVQYNSKCYQAWANLAQLYQSGEQYTDAESAYQSALRFCPPHLREQLTTQLNLVRQPGRLARPTGSFPSSDVHEEEREGGGFHYGMGEGPSGSGGRLVPAERPPLEQTALPRGFDANFVPYNAPYQHILPMGPFPESGHRAVQNPLVVPGKKRRGRPPNENHDAKRARLDEQKIATLLPRHATEEDAKPDSWAEGETVATVNEGLELPKQSAPVEGEAAATAPQGGEVVDVQISTAADADSPIVAAAALDPTRSAVVFRGIIGAVGMDTSVYFTPAVAAVAPSLRIDTRTQRMDDVRPGSWTCPSEAGQTTLSAYCRYQAFYAEQQLSIGPTADARDGAGQTAEVSVLSTAVIDQSHCASCAPHQASITEHTQVDWNTATPRGDATRPETPPPARVPHTPSHPEAEGFDGAAVASDAETSCEQGEVMDIDVPTAQPTALDAAPSPAPDETDARMTDASGDATAPCEEPHSLDTAAKQAKSKRASRKRQAVPCGPFVGCVPMAPVELLQYVSPKKSRNLYAHAGVVKFATNIDITDRNKWSAQWRELEKLPAFMRIGNACDSLTYLGGRPVLGVNTVQLYAKVPGCKTPGHQENNSLCSINFSVGPGDCEWFVVHNRYWEKVKELLRSRSLDFMNASWWPAVDELRAAGVPVESFIQRAGDLVWVCPGTVHWVRALGVCNNVSWNVGPLVANQYNVAWERSEGNANENFLSLVPMATLSYNIAQEAPVLFGDFALALSGHLNAIVARNKDELSSLEALGIEPQLRPPSADEPPAYYCARCNAEVFNILYALPEGGSFQVHCAACAHAIVAENAANPRQRRRRSQSDGPLGSFEVCMRRTQAHLAAVAEYFALRASLVRDHENASTDDVAETAAMRLRSAPLVTLDSASRS